MRKECPKLIKGSSLDLNEFKNLIQISEASELCPIKFQRGGYMRARIPDT